MAFRVYDKKKKRFVTDNIYLTPDGELVESKKSIWENKMTFVDGNRFVFQKSTELFDRDNTEIFVGDYLSAEVSDDRIVEGLVTFAEDLGNFVILCFDTGEYFVLSQSVCSRIKVIKNIFDDEKKGKKDGKSN